MRMIFNDPSFIPPIQPRNHDTLDTETSGQLKEEPLAAPLRRELESVMEVMGPLLSQAFAIRDSMGITEDDVVLILPGNMFKALHQFYGYRVLHLDVDKALVGLRVPGGAGYGPPV